MVGIGTNQTDGSDHNDKNHRQHNRVFRDVLTTLIPPESLEIVFQAFLLLMTQQSRAQDNRRHPPPSSRLNLGDPSLCKSTGCGRVKAFVALCHDTPDRWRLSGEISCAAEGGSFCFLAINRAGNRRRGRKLKKTFRLLDGTGYRGEDVVSI